MQIEQKIAYTARKGTKGKYSSSRNPAKKLYNVGWLVVKRSVLISNNKKKVAVSLVRI